MQVNDLPGDEYPFTPAPWLPKEQGDANQWFIMANDHKWLFYLQQNGELTNQQQQANIRLIAAAPDLLAALQLAMDALVNENQPIHAAISAANKALKKVYGN